MSRPAPGWSGTRPAGDPVRRAAGAGPARTPRGNGRADPRTATRSRRGRRDAAWADSSTRADPIPAAGRVARPPGGPSAVRFQLVDARGAAGAAALLGLQDVEADVGAAGGHGARGRGGSVAA